MLECKYSLGLLVIDIQHNLFAFVLFESRSLYNVRTSSPNLKTQVGKWKIFGISEAVLMPH